MGLLSKVQKISDDLMDSPEYSDEWSEDLNENVKKDKSSLNTDQESELLKEQSQQSNSTPKKQWVDKVKKVEGTKQALSVRDMLKVDEIKNEKSDSLAEKPINDINPKDLLKQAIQSRRGKIGERESFVAKATRSQNINSPDKHR